LWPLCRSRAPTKFCRVRLGRPRPAAANRDPLVTPDPPETTASQARLDRTESQVDLDQTPRKPTSSRQRLTNAPVRRQLDPEGQKDPPDLQEIMGNLEARDLMVNPEQLDRQDHLVQTEAPAHLDPKDHPETMANKVLEQPDQKDLPAPLDHLAHPDPAENLVPMANLVDLEHLAPQVTKARLAMLEDPAKMAVQEDLETRDHPARARNALRLVWLLAISQLSELMIPRCAVHTDTIYLSS